MFKADLELSVSLILFDRQKPYCVSYKLWTSSNMFSRFCSCMGRSRIKLEEPEHRATTDVESVSKDLGLFTLNETAEDTEYEVDVVAIHGLGGDWQGTWTADNGRLWLRDFLPAEVQNARMFSYGYNSQIAFTKSVADISDVARMLLDSLKGERKGAAVTRPLVFISHSLGGIIVKKVRDPQRYLSATHLMATVISHRHPSLLVLACVCQYLEQDLCFPPALHSRAYFSALVKQRRSDCIMRS